MVCECYFKSQVLHSFCTWLTRLSITGEKLGAICRIHAVLWGHVQQNLASSRHLHKHQTKQKGACHFLKLKRCENWFLVLIPFPSRSRAAYLPHESDLVTGDKRLSADADGCLSIVPGLRNTDSVAGAWSDGQRHQRTSIRGKVSFSWQICCYHFQCKGVGLLCLNRSEIIKVGRTSDI